MSRSYKKRPTCRMALWRNKNHHTSMKPGKQCSNRKIRRFSKRNLDFYIPNGRYYRFLGISSYDIWEFNFYETEKEAIKNWENKQQAQLNGANNGLSSHSTLEETIECWKSSYLRK